MLAPNHGKQQLWYLEGFVDSERKSWRTAIRRLPFRIGRAPECELCLDSLTVSNHHAELYEDEGELWIHDQNSSNGTAVNHETVTAPRRLQDGDLIQFADLQFRLALGRAREGTAPTGTIPLVPAELHKLMAEDGRFLRELIEQEAVSPVFQPVVRFNDGATLGYELLSRGHLADFETSAAELFHVAERLGVEVEFSRMCRSRGVREAHTLPEGTWVFLNTHPSELQDSAGLVDSFVALRREAPPLGFVVEIHEAAITDPEAVLELSSALRDLGFLLAFDDFGAGRSRLLEIATEPPDFLKFDVRLVQKLESARSRRRKVVKSLVEMADSLGITTIAEGVETEEECEACRETGFDAGQGHHFGRPQPASSLLGQGDVG